MELSMDNITPIRLLKESDASSVFEALLNDKTCILKVYHTPVQRNQRPSFLEKDPFLCESTAYSRFKETGVCAQGTIPDLLGIIKQINPHRWKPHLDSFLEDELPPNAIVIEYIPNLQRIDLTNYTKDRAVALQNIIREIHKVRVVHGDPYPRNMMVQPETGRVFWIDFDRAQTLPYGPLNFYVYDWFRMDAGMTDELMDDLAEDQKNGKLSRAWGFYYQYS